MSARRHAPARRAVDAVRTARAMRAVRAVHAMRAVRAVRALRPARSVRAALLAGALLASPRAALAHEGPPYPLIMDEPMPPWTVSLWADPDVGIGTFYMTVEAAPGHALPPDTHVRLWVMPADGRREEVAFDAERTVRDDDQRHVAEVEFDTEEDWSIRVVIEAASARRECTFIEPVTPPGFGALDLLWYAAPFVLVGFLWVKAALKRRAWRRGQQEPGQADVAGGTAATIGAEGAAGARSLPAAGPGARGGS
jgi:hypothetical protein